MYKIALECQAAGDFDSLDVHQSDSRPGEKRSAFHAGQERSTQQRPYTLAQTNL